MASAGRRLLAQPGVAQRFDPNAHRTDQPLQEAVFIQAGGTEFTLVLLRLTFFGLRIPARGINPRRRKTEPPASPGEYSVTNSTMKSASCAARAAITS
jgi:hypothetical protein